VIKAVVNAAGDGGRGAGGQKLDARGARLDAQAIEVALAV